ncbi:MAG: hypothetical protein AAFV45_15810 [Pseudomonadota bacterium]
MGQSSASKGRPRLVSPIVGFLRGAAFGALSMGALAVVGAGAYVAKSAAGIDLMEGHSPLHKPLWPVAKELRAVWVEVRKLG